MSEHEQQHDGDESSAIGGEYKDLASATNAQIWAENLEASQKGVELVMWEDRADMIATVANNEAKALTLAAMAASGNRELSTRDIYDLFISMQGDVPAWDDMNLGGPAGYAENTFVTIGTVAKHVTSTPGGARRKRFELTEYGEKIGVATVGMMLDQSLKYPDIALYELFGKTGTPKDADHRAPYSRIQILAELAKHPQEFIRTSDLIENTGLGAVTGPVPELGNSGLVEVERYEAGDSDVQIAVPDVEAFAAQPVRTDTSDFRAKLQQFIIGQIQAGAETVGIEEIHRYAAQIEPDEEVSSRRTRVSQAISFWRGQGLVEKSSQTFSEDERALVRLQPDSIELVNDMLAHVQALVEADEGYLEWGRQRAHEILGDPELVNRLLEKAKAASPFKNREEQAAFESRILDIMGDKELAAAKVAELVKAGGKPISASRVRQVMAAMTESGVLERRVLGTTFLFRRTNATTPSG